MKTEKKFILVMLGIILLVPTGCGKKGPPFLPKKGIPPRVEHLTVEFKSGDAVLHGRIIGLPQGYKDKGAGNITACRVYHVWYSSEDSPCEGCPIDYPAYRDTRGEIRARAEFYCELSIEAKEGIHFFEVRLIAPDGTIGPASNRVKLTVEH